MIHDTSDADPPPIDSSAISDIIMSGNFSSADSDNSSNSSNDNNVISTSFEEENSPISIDNNSSALNQEIQSSFDNNTATTPTPLSQAKIRVACLWSLIDASVLAQDHSEDLADMKKYNANPQLYELYNIPLTWRNSVQEVTDLVASEKYDLFLVFCDGLDACYSNEADNGAGVEVVETLAKLGAIFAGPSPLFYLITKRQMKQTAVESGVQTPNYFFVDDLGQNEEALNNYIVEQAACLNFPLIVKHHNGHGSEGMHQCSKVIDFPSLISEVRRNLEAYGSALVEEFITGREFTVMICENPQDPETPIMYHPFECELPSLDSFKHVEQKFVNYNTLQWKPSFDKKLNATMQEMTRKIFLACNGNFYARCDFRMSEETGQMYFLEINSVASVFSEEFGSCDYILEYTKSHRSFLENLMKLARPKSSGKLGGLQRKKLAEISNE